jgi:omega-hydroxy-beta-dihydromenaquinone-9 sulfotransferase
MERGVLHPLVGARPNDLVRTLLSHGGFAPRYSGHAALMFLCGVLQSPLFLVETLRTWSLATASLDQPPVIIVGHWRSGTTFLHNLMSRDAAFCFPTIADVFRPYNFYPGPFEFISRAILRYSLPAVRPMDDVPLTEDDLPQEDEIALASMGAPSFFNAFYFPGKMTQIVGEEIFLEDSCPGLQALWRQRTRYFLAKVAHLSPNRRLLLKNPAHSARINLLREMFPGTKFIHIHRDPLEVIASTRKLYRHLLPLLALQHYDLAIIDQQIVDLYLRLMKSLCVNLAKLPAGDVGEVRYQDLVAKPTEVVATVYERLGLEGFHAAEPSISEFARRPHGAQAIDPSDWQLATSSADRLAHFRALLGYSAS